MMLPSKLLVSAGISALLTLSACGDDGYVGPLVRVTGTFNNWAKGEHAAPLTWEGDAYRGVLDLPGDSLQFRIFSPYTDQLIGAQQAGDGSPIPSTLRTMQRDEQAPPLRVNTPLLTRYAVEYRPGQGMLHIDLAPGAEDGLPAGAAQLVVALRGTDQAEAPELARRAATFQSQVQELARTGKLETPLQIGSDTTEGAGVTFLSFGAVDSPDYSVVGNFNDWTEGVDRVQMVLDGTVGYRARVVKGTRLEYRLALHGMRRADPLNAEIVWDGAYLPPNLKNVLGGNVGDFNSVSKSPGYLEQGSRLRVVRLPEREFYVYLPPKYEQNADRQYPSIYIHDGKDALVRGRYNQALDQLISARRIPEVVAVFIPAQADANARLAEYANFRDNFFADIEPRGNEYRQLLLNGILPAVEGSFRVAHDPDQRAMLGVDMAGPLSFFVAWEDNGQTFRRVGSQSGRFGWGATELMPSPYVMKLAKDLSATMKSLSFDWADGDQFQVAVHETAIRPLFQGTGYKGKVSFVKQDKPVGLPSPTVWDNWRSRLDTALVALLGDLPIK